MRTNGRLKAAVEILEEIDARHVPCAKALADWGRGHRFAGSGDRSAIATFVYDALRRRLSLASRMNDTSARALVIGAYADAFGLGADEVASVVDGSEHALSALSVEERGAIERQVAVDAPFHVRGDIPEWVFPSFVRTFGTDERAAEVGAGLSQRAPVDVRANTLKSTRERILKALEKFGAVEAPYVPNGVRINVPSAGARMPNIEAETGHGKGWFEVQDAGSQIAVALSGVGPRQQVLDLCAGAGGKTLALAAQMQNTGQIYCYDADKFQLRPIFERLRRAGVRNVQVLDAGDERALLEHAERFDVVLVDAPCSGSGTWRRRPDAKWRLTQAHLSERIGEQAAILDRAAKMVRPGGRIVYVTCSVLNEENADQIHSFVERTVGFSVVPYRDVWRANLAGDPPVSEDGGDDGLLLTPDLHGTDGFYIAVIEKAAE